jgi:hypothetical protein
MIEARHRHRFLEESLFDERIAGMLFVKLFDGDDAPRGVYIFGLEDGAEAATAEVIGYEIIANASAAHYSRSGDLIQHDFTKVRRLW